MTKYATFSMIWKVILKDKGTDNGTAVL